MFSNLNAHLLLYMQALEDTGFYDVDELRAELKVLRLENKLLRMQHGSVDHLLPPRRGARGSIADVEAAATAVAALQEEVQQRRQREDKLRLRLSTLQEALTAAEDEHDELRRACAAERALFAAKLREAQSKQGCACTVS
jgi:septal ring factor EnvC (AmiA/AmiB activator)